MSKVDRQEIIDAIKSMDKKSEVFFEIFELVNEKYFDFDEPDAYQKSALYLNTILHRGEEWMIELVVNLAHNLFQVVDMGVPATAGSFQVKGKDVHFNFSTEKSALKNLEKMLRQTVIVKAKDQGIDILGDPRP